MENLRNGQDLANKVRKTYETLDKVGKKPGEAVENMKKNTKRQVKLGGVKIAQGAEHKVEEIEESFKKDRESADFRKEAFMEEFHKKFTLKRATKENLYIGGILSMAWGALGNDTGDVLAAWSVGPDNIMADKLTRREFLALPLKVLRAYILYQGFYKKLFEPYGEEIVNGVLNYAKNPLRGETGEVVDKKEVGNVPVVFNGEIRLIAKSLSQAVTRKDGQNFSTGKPVDVNNYASWGSSYFTAEFRAFMNCFHAMRSTDSRNVLKGMVLKYGGESQTLYSAQISKMEKYFEETKQNWDGNIDPAEDYRNYLLLPRENGGLGGNNDDWELLQALVTAYDVSNAKEYKMLPAGLRANIGGNTISGLREILNAYNRQYNAGISPITEMAETGSNLGGDLEGTKKSASETGVKIGQGIQTGVETGTTKAKQLVEILKGLVNPKKTE